MGMTKNWPSHGLKLVKIGEQCQYHKFLSHNKYEVHTNCLKSRTTARSTFNKARLTIFHDHIRYLTCWGAEPRQQFSSLEKRILPTLPPKNITHSSRTGHNDDNNHDISHVIRVAIKDKRFGG